LIDLLSGLTLKKLALNVEKTSMIFKTRRTEAAFNTSLKNNGEIMEIIEHARNIDQKLAFKDHLVSATKKMSSKLKSWEDNLENRPRKLNF
jgi:hypothetical protein